jgi:hypothetical protein
MNRPTGKNTDPSPMTHETIHVPSRIRQRAQLLDQVRTQGDDMTMAELQDTAAELGVDTSGLRKKEDVREAITGTGDTGPTDTEPGA